MQYGMMMLPLEWTAKRRCIEFWMKVLRMHARRVVKLTLETLESRGKVKWLEDVQCGVLGLDG